MMEADFSCYGNMMKCKCVISPLLNVCYARH